MGKLRNLATRFLTRILYIVEPEILVYPPIEVDWSARNFGRPEAQTARYLGGTEVPAQHEHFGHIRLWDVYELAKDSQDYELPDAVRQAIGTNHDILDVACGFGNDGEKMIRLGNRVWGLDIIQRCLNRALERGLITQRVDLNVEPFPFEDGRFDVVTSFNTIEHLYHWRHFISECIRVLKPDGVFICLTFNIAWRNYRRQLAEGTLGFGDNNIRHFSTYALRRWLNEDFSLSVESIYPDDAPSILLICRLCQ
jgi:SAM-dependent methyltransferase